ncbi:MAG TPA: WXG100 family type VII secretion target [Candidatus Choladocola avistercoris]|nr:WXG100 family type VII secretion target [Candidatus Choladocola avistercoris]
MASFITTPAQLRAKAEELSSLNNSFKTNVSELEAEEQNLMGMWEGQAKEAFHQAFSSDKIQMTNFSTLIEKYVASLITIAAKYEEAERINTETATARKYK